MPKYNLHGQFQRKTPKELGDINQCSGCRANIRQSLLSWRDDQHPNVFFKKCTARMLSLIMNQQKWRENTWRSARMATRETGLSGTLEIKDLLKEGLKYLKLYRSLKDQNHERLKTAITEEKGDVFLKKRSTCTRNLLVKRARSLEGSHDRGIITGFPAASLGRKNGEGRLTKSGTQRKRP